MPFTFSHAAAVLPFCKAKKIRVSATGLIIGSMVPDFEFLFLLRESDYVGHLWPGIILFNIPAAIACAFVFHYLVRNSLILHLPLFLQQRFYGFLTFNWKTYFKQHYVAFILSAAAGVATHIFIDAFTHKSGFMARPASFFQAEIKVLVFPLPVYFILQLLTSLAGGIYVLWYVLRLKKVKGPQHDCRPFKYWSLFFIAVPVVLLLRFTVTSQYRSHEDIIIAATGSLLYALLFVSAVFYKQVRQQLYSPII